MESGSKRSLVSAEQLATLLDFMKEHPDLAQGLNRGRRGKLMTVKVWGTCAKKLNAIEGASKNGKGWSKYWCDWKYRVKRHALELKAAREANQTGPDMPAPLSPIEQTIIDIIGEGALEGIVIKTNPLADDNEQNGEASENYETRAKRRRRNKSSSDDNRPDSRSSFENKTKIKNRNSESDDDEAAKFLDLERRKLQAALDQVDSTNQITAALNRLVDVLERIRAVKEAEARSRSA